MRTECLFLCAIWNVPFAQGEQPCIYEGTLARVRDARYLLCCFWCSSCSSIELGLGFAAPSANVQRNDRSKCAKATSQIAHGKRPCVLKGFCYVQFGTSLLHILGEV